MPASLAQSFFEHFLRQSDKVAFLNGLIAQKTEETEWLEFKGCVDADPAKAGAQLEKRERQKAFSEAVCGFANTSGGVLIWGIDARKDPVTNIDFAASLSLADDVGSWYGNAPGLAHQSRRSAGWRSRDRASTLPTFTSRIRGLPRTSEQNDAASGGGKRCTPLHDALERLISTDSNFSPPGNVSSAGSRITGSPL